MEKHILSSSIWLLKKTAAKKQIVNILFEQRDLSAMCNENLATFRTLSLQLITIPKVKILVVAGPNLQGLVVSLPADFAQARRSLQLSHQLHM